MKKYTYVVKRNIPMPPISDTDVVENTGVGIQFEHNGIIHRHGVRLEGEYSTNEAAIEKAAPYLQKWREDVISGRFV